MSVEELQLIDTIGSDADGSVATLNATAPLEWGDAEHLMKVQDKLNRCQDM